MINACKENNVKLVISHQRRFTPGWEKAKELVEDGIIGAPLFVELKALEGLLNWATHNIDGSRYIIGDPQTEWVFGSVERTTNKYERNTRIEDSCMGLIQYKNGIQSFIQSDLIQYDYKSKWATNHPIFIRGEIGALDITEFEVKFLGGKNSSWQVMPADIPKEEIDPIGGQTNGKLVKELVEWLNGSNGHRCSGDKAKQTLDIMMSIYQSARLHEKVFFPVEEDKYPLDLMFDEGKIPLKEKERYDIRGFLERSNIDENDYNRLKILGLPHHQIMQKVKRV
jgi:predicted dehydrogenase